MLKLSKSIEFNGRVQPAKLPIDCGENISNYEDVTLAGAGRIDFDVSDGLLYEAELKTKPCEKCRRRNPADIRSFICTTDVIGLPMMGDSGNFEKVVFFALVIFVVNETFSYNCNQVVHFYEIRIIHWLVF